MTAELPLEQCEKYTAEDLRLTFNFTGKDVPKGVTIASVAALYVTTMDDVASADVTISGAVFSGHKVQALFLGGIPGTTYKLVCRANMSDGQVPLERRAKLYIKTV